VEMPGHLLFNLNIESTGSTYRRRASDLDPAKSSHCMTSNRE